MFKNRENKLAEVISVFLSKNAIEECVLHGINAICQLYDFDRVHCYIRVSNESEFVLLHECNNKKAPYMHVEENKIDFNVPYFRKNAQLKNSIVKEIIKEEFIHTSDFDKQYKKQMQSIGFVADEKNITKEAFICCIGSDAVGMMGYFVLEKFKGRKNTSENDINEIESLMRIITEKINNFEAGKQLKIEGKQHTYDSLTGMPLLSKFKKDAEQLLKKGESYTLIYLDIDKFKYINDIWSFETGNQILIELANVIREFVKEPDTCCRISDDKFLVLLKYTSDKQIKKITDDFNARIKEMQQKMFGDIKITFIAGAYISREEESLNLIIDKANIARRSIKGSYKNNFQIYNQNLENLREREKQLEKRMGPALDNGEFIPFLQPKFNIKTNEICGAEALARWRSKDRMISPIEFIPAFEKSGFIIKLDFVIYEQVFKFMKDCIEKGKKLVPISLNVSRGHINNPNFTC